MTTCGAADEHPHISFGASMLFVRCELCGVRVLERRLDRHRRKVHHPQPADAKARDNGSRGRWADISRVGMVYCAICQQPFLPDTVEQHLRSAHGYSVGRAKPRRPRPEPTVVVRSVTSGGTRAKPSAGKAKGSDTRATSSRGGSTIPATGQQRKKKKRAKKKKKLRGAPLREISTPMGGQPGWRRR